MLADNGASAHEIMAYLGHNDLALAALYTKAAEQKRLAAAGLKKLVG